MNQGIGLLSINGRDALAVWKRNCKVNLRLWRAEVFPPLLEPVVSILAFGWGIGSLIASQTMEIPYLNFVGAGILVVTGMVRALLECTYGAYFRMVYQSTYDAILSTPVDAESLGAGEILWAATKAAFDSVLIMMILGAFGVLESPWSVLIPFVILAGAVGLAAASLAYTATISSIYQYSYFISVAFATLWLCGAYFPLERLPGALQYLCWVLPATSVVDLSRDLMTGRTDVFSWVEAGWILLSGVLSLEVALRQLRKRMY